MSSEKARSKSGVMPSPSAARTRPIWAYLWCSSRFLRDWSTARRLATVISQAPELRGTPDSGASPAMSRADSIRTTASIAACVSESATTTDQTISAPAGARLTAGGAGPLHQHHRPCSAIHQGLQRDPGPGAAIRSVDLPDRAFAVAGDAEEPLGPLDRLVLVTDVEQRPAADQFLRLAEWPVGHGELPVSARHLGCLRRGC